MTTSESPNPTPALKLDPLRPPIGPDTAGYLDESTYLDQSLLDMLWRNEIHTLATQYGHLMLERLTAFQVLNFCTFMTVQLANQIMMSGDQRAIDLVNFYTTRAFAHFDALDKKGVFKQHVADHAEGKAPRFLLEIPDHLTPEERNIIKQALDNSPRLEQ